MHSGCVIVLYCLSVHTWHCLPPEYLNRDGLLKTEYRSVVHIHTVCCVTDTEVSGLADHNLHAYYTKTNFIAMMYGAFGLLK